MTHREARRKLGSRSRRRANTNGKNIKGTSGGSGKRRTPTYRHPRHVKRISVQVARLVAAAVCVLLMVGCGPDIDRTVTCNPVGEFVGYVPSFRSNLTGIVKTTKGEFQLTTFENVSGIYGEPVQSCHDWTGSFINIGGRRY